MVGRLDQQLWCGGLALHEVVGVDGEEGEEGEERCGGMEVRVGVRRVRKGVEVWR